MDDETRQLEAELNRLQPAPVSRRLLERIETQLAPTPVPARRRYTPWLWAAAFPAAAAIALLFTQYFRGPTNSPASASSAAKTKISPVHATGEAPLKPVAAEKVLVSADDEGLVTLADGTQARRERLHYIDTITWQNPRTNASLKWTMPREEVRVVPIAFQ